MEGKVRESGLKFQSLLQARSKSIDVNAKSLKKKKNKVKKSSIYQEHEAEETPKPEQSFLEEMILF